MKKTQSLFASQPQFCVLILQCNMKGKLLLDGNDRAQISVLPVLQAELSLRSTPCLAQPDLKSEFAQINKWAVVCSPRASCVLAEQTVRIQVYHACLRGGFALR